MHEYFDACLQQCIIKKYLPHREWLCNLECIKKFQIVWLHSLAPKLLHWKINAYPKLLKKIANNITWQKSSLKLLYHHGPHVSKANTNGNDADVAPEFSPLKTVQFGNPSQDIVDPRDGGFGGRLWRWKWEKWIKAIYWGVNGSWIENQ